MRHGVIKIPDAIYSKHYDIVCKVFIDVRPLRIEYRPELVLWEIYGVSDKLDELIEGELLPEYSLMIDNDQNVYIVKK